MELCPFVLGDKTVVIDAAKRIAFLRFSRAEVPSVVLKDTASHKVIVEGAPVVDNSSIHKRVLRAWGLKAGSLVNEQLSFNSIYHYSLFTVYC